MNTIAIDMESAKLEVATKAGANHTLNSRGENTHSRLQELTNGRGPDIVIRMLESSRFPVDEAISIVVPLDDAPGILADWSAAHGKYTKILVQIP